MKSQKYDFTDAKIEKLQCTELFAGDMITFVENNDGLIHMTRDLQEECYSSGVKINFNKTEYMCVSEENESINISMMK